MGRAALQLRVGRQDFTVSCEAGEEELMQSAVRRVERALGEARSRYHAADGERAALMAALWLAFDTEKKNAGKTPDLDAEEGRIELLSERIRAVLARTGSPQERDGT